MMRSMSGVTQIIPAFARVACFGERGSERARE
jgi:hypothetical protein